MDVPVCRFFQQNSFCKHTDCRYYHDPSIVEKVNHTRHTPQDAQHTQRTFFPLSGPMNRYRTPSSKMTSAIRFSQLNPHQIWDALEDPAVNNELSPSDLASALYHLSKAPYPQYYRSRVENLIIRLQLVCGHLGARNVSNTFITCRRWNITDENFLNSLYRQGYIVAKNFNTQEIGNTLNSLSHILPKRKKYDGQFTDKDSSQLINVILEEIQQKVGDFKSQEIANTLNALVKLDIHDAVVIELLCIQAVNKVSQFNAQEIANTLNALAKFDLKEDSTIRAFCAEVLKKSKDFTPQGVGNTLNALAKVDLYDEEVIKAMCVETLCKARDFIPQNIANTLNALAKFGVYDHSVVKTLCAEILAKARDFNAQDIGNTLSSLSRLGLYDEAVFRALCLETLTKAKTFIPQNIANMLSALADFNIRDDAVISLLSVEMLAKVKDFNSQSLATTLNSLARLDVYDESVIRALMQEALVKVRLFNAQDISSTLFALAKFNVFNEQLVKSLCMEAVTKAKDFSSLDISNTLNALVKFNYYSEAMLKCLCLEIVEKAKFVSAQEITNTLDALSKFSVHDEAVILTLCAEIPGKVTSFSAQDIATTLHALAKFNVREQVLLEALCSEALARVSAYNWLDVANVLHALVILQHYDRSLIEALWPIIFAKPQHVDDNAVFAMDQVAQASLGLSLEKGSWGLPLAPEEFVFSAKEVRKLEHSGSSLHQAVSLILTEKAVLHASEFVISGLIVDIALEHERLVIEVDGPSRLFRGSNRMDGFCLFKRRMLAHLGWKTYSIPFFAWKSLRDTSQQHAYISELLQLGGEELSVPGEEQAGLPYTVFSFPDESHWNSPTPDALTLTAQASVPVYTTADIQLLPSNKMRSLTKYPNNPAPRKLYEARPGNVMHMGPQIRDTSVKDIQLHGSQYEHYEEDYNKDPWLHPVAPKSLLPRVSTDPTMYQRMVDYRAPHMSMDPRAQFWDVNTRDRNFTK